MPASPSLLLRHEDADIAYLEDQFRRPDASPSGETKQTKTKHETKRPYTGSTSLAQRRQSPHRQNLVTVRSRIAGSNRRQNHNLRHQLAKIQHPMPYEAAKLYLCPKQKYGSATSPVTFDEVPLERYCPSRSFSAGCASSIFTYSTTISARAATGFSDSQESQVQVLWPQQLHVLCHVLCHDVRFSVTRQNDSFS